MRRRKFIAELGGAAAVTFVLCAGSTFAKDSEDRLDTPTYKKCMESSGGVTGEAKSHAAAPGVAVAAVGELAGEAGKQRCVSIKRKP